ncbi:hypothetical protein PVW46_24715 [Mameliella sp. AT18]|uniref:hypothetical protein n=1 Tax=Mameliella sp. AT18 TaxID=3028385 RepID=UPI00237AF0E2|nr:hypothetical protein [Mameliella sp. AT18]MDD9733116.1 hypothetical protein [Mameliella sp. AT18]
MPGHIEPTFGHPRSVDEIKDVLAPGWRQNCLATTRKKTISRKRCFNLLSVVTGTPQNSIKIAYRDAREAGAIETSFQRGVHSAGLSQNQVLCILLFTMIKSIGVAMRHRVETVGFDLGLARGRVFIVRVPGPLSRSVKLRVPNHPLDCESIVALAWEQILADLVEE